MKPAYRTCGMFKNTGRFLSCTKLEMSSMRAKILLKPLQISFSCIFTSLCGAFSISSRQMRDAWQESFRAKAITCQMTSIIFSLTSLFFSCWRPCSWSSWSFCACGCIFFFFFSPPDPMLSQLPSCWMGRSCSMNGPSHSLGFLFTLLLPKL